MRTKTVVVNKTTLEVREFDNGMTIVTGPGDIAHSICAFNETIGYATIGDDVWRGFHPLASGEFRLAVIAMICDELYKDVEWYEITATDGAEE